MFEQSKPIKTPCRPGAKHQDFSPSHLNVFEQCPERYYWKYIRNTKTPKKFDQALKIGWAAHDVLETCGTTAGMGSRIRTISCD